MIAGDLEKNNVLGHKLSRQNSHEKRLSELLHSRKKLSTQLSPNVPKLSRTATTKIYVLVSSDWYDNGTGKQ